MRNYEVTFIVDPVLSGDEIKATAQTYVDHLKEVSNKVVDVDEMGLRQLAYPLNKRTSGVYYSIEFQSETGGLIPKMELALRRDERIMRFLTVRLDKYGVKYNEDKRKGLIGKKKDKKEKVEEEAPQKSAQKNKKEPPSEPKTDTAPDTAAKTTAAKEEE
jgi:small subunit ribosomal protein S6